MNKLKALLTAAALFAGGSSVFGFVMIGPVMPEEQQSGNISFNITDDLGGPKDIKNFYRWNMPYLTYSFDLSFVQYFGIDGMEAVHEAFEVVNDFFEPRDNSYSGVSEMDFARDGFRSNYNTAWVNTTAQNQQIIDLKSLVLGMVVNQLGVGNPHRYSFTIRNISTNTTASQWNFNVRLRNFDPITWQPTDKINGVTYSYRLIHNFTPQAGGAITVPANPIMDMEEFTTDTSGNAWSSVSSITDAFYGNTAIYWTDSPTLFNFGVYYSGLNSMGGQYQPRHALTYDDAGALKYLYRTNNFVHEDLSQIINLVTPPQFLSGRVANNFLNQNNNFIGTTAPSARPPRTFPRRFGTTPLSFPTTSPFRGIPIIGGVAPNRTALMTGLALRGGIDTIQFYHVPFDSLVGITFQPTNFTWTDTFVATNGLEVSGLNNTTPGASAYFRTGPLKYFTQTVGRTVTSPDMIFVADELGQSIDGVPIAWNRTDNTDWVDNYTNSTGLVAVSATNMGPGVIELPPAPQPIVYTFGKMSEGFELIWAGEASVVGNQNTYSMWGHIKGPGPEDLVIFPNDNMIWRLENEITPKVAVPTISMISDNAGLTPIATNSFTRTEETISIIGSGLSSGTAIEILDGNRVLQTLYPVEKYLVNDTRLDIPPGVLTEGTEGTARQIRVWNSIGPSQRSPQFFNIYTGRAVVTGTTSDGSIYDRAQALTIYGFGFKSTQGRAADEGASLSHLRLEDGQGNVIYPGLGTNNIGVGFEVLSDTQAVMPIDTLKSSSDGTYRRIRVARGSGTGSLSVTNNVNLINFVTTKPNVSDLETIDVDGTKTALSSTIALRRDRGIELRGTAMNTAIAIEIVNQDGSSFANPMVINLPNAGVSVEDNGTRIQISANVFPWSDADGHTATSERKFKVYNAVGNFVPTTTFNVNVQPTFAGYGGFIAPGAFNRHGTLGDDITITGSGLLAISEIQFVDETGAALTGTPNIVLPNPGVTVTDTSIKIDTSVSQFNNVSNADSTTTSRYRRFRLVSGRDAVMSHQSTRFEVGLPPTFTSITSTGSTLNYRRDNDTLTFNGTGLGLVQKAEFVDINGNPITGVSALTDATGLASVTASSFAISASAPGITGQENLIDSVTLLSSGRGARRLRVSTPFGVTTSTMASGFTISATPALLPQPTPNAASSFAGGGFNGGTTTYTLGDGDLVINGTNLRGVNQIVFEDTSNERFHEVAVDPNAPPTGISFNAAGTRINVTAAYITASNPMWADSESATDRRIQLTSAASQSVQSPAIITTGSSVSFSSFSGTGWSGPHYKRSGELFIDEFTGKELSTVTSATLVDANGNAITGIAAVSGGSLTVWGNRVRIAANAFDSDGKEADSLLQARRLKLVRSSGGDLISTFSFTVSSVPTLSATVATVYAGSGDGGAAGGTYDRSTGDGSISITAPTEDMNGITKIEFMDTSTSLPVPGTSPLTTSDWTVSADGLKITISAATMTAKGLKWYSPSSTTAIRAFRLTTAAGDTVTSAAIIAQP